MPIAETSRGRDESPAHNNCRDTVPCDRCVVVPYLLNADAQLCTNQLHLDTSPSLRLHAM